MARLKRFVPTPLWLGIKQIKRALLRGLRRTFELCGLNIARRADYYSPLPTETQIHQKRSRWDKPSALGGVNVELPSLKARFSELTSKQMANFLKLPTYDECAALGFGPGFPELDAFTLFSVVREIKPKRYLEVGSGLSTFYCSLAAAENAKENRPVAIKCIEPYPFPALAKIPGIELIQKEVQDVPLSVFQELEAGDILFIDSSHSVRIDGDVPYLFLEVVPALKPGVLVHVHDIPFPFNTPFPAEQWVLGKQDYAPYWPIYWTEAMLVQSFLAFNSRFEIFLSTPILRHFDEEFLKRVVPFYKTIQAQPNTFSSLWFKRLS
jgi:hypothetical protein